MTDIVQRLREWSAADMDTHASLRRNGQQVAEVPWARHGTDLAEVVLDAAAEIERLRRVIDTVHPQMQAEMDRLRAATPCRCGDRWHAIECDCPPAADETRARGHSGGGCARPGGVAATPIAQTAPARSWRDLTSGEADAWREGWEAHRHAAVEAARDMAAIVRAQAKGCPGTLATAATIETVADAIARMRIPPARREPTGLEVRGG
jgi:hypothetical protein